jgi:hypothetical protein
VTRYLTGLVTAVLAGCAGGWLMLAPFALGTQPAATTWTDATRVEFFTGLGVAVLAALVLLAWAIAWVRRLRTDGALPGPTPHVTDGQPIAVAAATGEPPTVAELHDVLAPLVAALAADLHRPTSPTTPAQPPHTEQAHPAGTGGTR